MSINYTNIANGLGFTISHEINLSPSKGLFILSGKYMGEDALLKIVTTTDKDRSVKFVKEKTIEDIIEKYNKNAKPGQKILKNKIIDAGVRGDITFQIKSFIKGESLTEYISGEPLGGYDLIKRPYLKMSGRVTDFCYRQISNLRAIVDNRITEYPRRFKTHFSQTELNAVMNFVDLELSATAKEFENQKIEYYESKNICCCMSDFTASNIISSSGGALYLTDFEWLCRDNYMVDVVFAWIYLWRYPDWQAKLYDKFIHTKYDKQNFNLTIFRLVTHMLLERTKRLDQKTFFSQHMWKKYLENLENNISNGKLCESFYVVNKVK